MPGTQALQPVPGLSPKVGAPEEVELPAAQTRLVSGLHGNRVPSEDQDENRLQARGAQDQAQQDPAVHAQGESQARGQAPGSGKPRSRGHSQRDHPARGCGLLARVGRPRTVRLAIRKPMEKQRLPALCLTVVAPEAVLLAAHPRAFAPAQAAAQRDLAGKGVGHRLAADLRGGSMHLDALPRLGPGQMRRLRTLALATPGPEVLGRLVRDLPGVAASTVHAPGAPQRLALRTGQGDLPEETRVEANARRGLRFASLALPNSGRVAAVPPESRADPRPALENLTGKDPKHERAARPSTPCGRH